MVSPRKHIGKLSTARAALLVFGGVEKRSETIRKHRGIKPRKGLRIKLASRKRIIKTATQQRLKQFLRHYEREIKRLSIDKKQSVYLTRLRTTRKLLKSAMKRGIQKPTIYQLAAVLAYEHGLKKEQLLPHLNSLYSIMRSNPGAQFWEGTTTALAHAVRKDLPFRIEEILRKNRLILDSYEIAQQLKISANRQNLSSINVSIQLLDQMDLVQKHPDHAPIPSVGSTIVTFSHRQHGALPIRHPSVLLTILEAAHKNGARGVLLTEIYKERVKKDGHKYGNPKANFRDSSVSQAKNKLKTRGLIGERTVRITRTTKSRTGSTSISEIYLTPEGKKLMDRFARNGRKSFEDLRYYLLGG
jgi:hypothetical protein